MLNVLEKIQNKLDDILIYISKQGILFKSPKIFHTKYLIIL